MITNKDQITMNTPLDHLIDYSSALNDQQLEAVTAPGGPILVIAGAGSGKTRTIVYRVAHLVEQGIDPRSILLLTFTRRAAEEMLSRAAQLLQRGLSQVAGGTFHSTGNLILRRFAALIGFDSGFSIMDQADSIDAVDHIRKEMKSVRETKGFPRARTVAAILSRTRNGTQCLNELLRKRYAHFEEYAQDIEAIGSQFEQYKKDNRLMDYDDLLVHTIRLLEENEQVRNEISDTWRHILVDEYQDTNHLQARIVRLLAAGHDNVMVVGDDSQSIYSFRGADFTNIMEFPNLFPGTRIIRLEENYRSTAPILAATNRIIEQAAVGYPKRLFTRQIGGTAPLALRPADEREQSRFVLKCVQELREFGVPLRDVAVLFRAGFHSFDLEGELARNGIHYVKHGGFKFLESQHIKDVLAHLRVTANPSDRLSWMRILRLLPGVGVKTATKIAADLAGAGRSAPSDDFAASGRKYSANLRELLALLKDLKEPGKPISEKVDQVNRYYFPFLKEKFDNYPKRMRDLEKLADMTVSYRSLNRFLSDMALEPPDEEKTGDDIERDSLVLSTIHSAKGLEWHTVILIWATEGSIPSMMSADSPEDLEEERRLLYVAATRAKRNLVLCAPQTMFDRRMGITHVAVSRFLDAVPSEYFRSLEGHD